MSYILYSSIARAGGIDLLLGMESFSHPPYHPLRRHSKGYGRAARLRRRSGRALIGLGGVLTNWGRRWAQPAGAASAGRSLQLAAE
ncbi:MAG: hypothetical protein GEU89_03930 [Kiloniellaceae bacterium]|nr:hypothetical protein [Kiloniellaceae bacterium]